MSVLTGFLIGLVILAWGVTATSILFCRWITKNHLAMIAAMNGKAQEWRAAGRQAEGYRLKAEGREKPKEVKDVGI